MAARGYMAAKTLLNWKESVSHRGDYMMKLGISPLEWFSGRRFTTRDSNFSFSYSYAKPYFSCHPFKIILKANERSKDLDRILKDL